MFYTKFVIHRFSILPLISLNLLFNHVLLYPCSYINILFFLLTGEYRVTIAMYSAPIKNNNYKIGITTALIALFIFSCWTNLGARTKSAMLLGVGNYEMLHIGINKSGPTNWYYETAIGINPIQFHYQMAYGAIGKYVWRNTKRNLKFGVQAKALVWHFNNRYNRFIIFTPNAECRLAKQFKKFELFLNGGFVYNTPLYYVRKTNLEVGWPNEWQPSFSLQFNFN